MGKTRKLYAIEERIKDLEPEQKTVQRQRLSKPVLDDLKGWLEKNIRRVPKDSRLNISNALEPYDYLHRALQHITAADTVEKIEALLPWNMKK